jgi:phosphoribosylglycinamide formyltransferase-1
MSSLEMARARLAVLCSGFGSNLQAIIEAVRSGQLPAEIVCVISDNPQAHCLTRARQNKIICVLLDPQKHSTRSAMDQAILSELRKYQADWVILAGFMRLLGPQLVAAYHNRILNIHPALLPSFPGVHAIKRAWEAKIPVTGVTVHFVDEGVDTGPIIVQKEVKILPGESLESLEKRIHEVEHRLYPKAIQQIITENKVTNSK